jgi:hypothetical protein
VGQAIVKTDIPWGGVTAYTRGQSIDTDAVEANGWQEHVVGENTKEAAEIKAEITGRPVEDFHTRSSGRTAASTSTKTTEG